MVATLRAECRVWVCKPHTPGPGSGLVQDQFQWQGAPVPFSQQADCCNLWELPHCEDIGLGQRSIVRKVWITGLHLADDPLIFADTTEVLSVAFESLSEETEPLGLRVSWIEV